MDWSSIQTGLESWIESASGVTDVYWQNQKRQAGWHSNVNILIIPESVSHVGIDENRHAYSAGEALGEEITHRPVGNRVMNLVLRCESQSQEPGELAAFYLDRLRLKMKYPSAYTAWNGFYVSLQNIGDTIIADFEDEHGRQVSVAEMAVTLNVAASDSVGEKTGFINVVKLSSNTLKNQSGQDLADQVDETISGS